MNNKSFLVLLLIATIMIAGIIAENAKTVTTPTPVEITVDTASVKEKIARAGLVPREAKYWKEL